MRVVRKRSFGQEWLCSVPEPFPGPRAEQGALVNVMKTIHTIIVVFLVVFCLYYAFTDPAGTARVIRGFFSGLFGFIRALGGQS